MERLEHKGYFGSIEYSKADGCFFGQVLGLGREVGITYEGRTAEELYGDFKEGVNHYLEHCKSAGVKPQKSYSGMLSIRIPPAIHSRVAAYAERNRTSISRVFSEAAKRQLQMAELY